MRGRPLERAGSVLGLGHRSDAALRADHMLAPARIPRPDGIVKAARRLANVILVTPRMPPSP